MDPSDAATGRARENAAAALLNLVLAGGESVVEEVLAAGSAEEAVGELAMDGEASSRGKAKAEVLLRALEEGAAAGSRRRREHGFADFLDRLVASCSPPLQLLDRNREGGRREMIGPRCPDRWIRHVSSGGLFASDQTLSANRWFLVITPSHIKC